MKKLLKTSYFLNFITILTFFCLFLDSIFYYGFTKKHLYLNSKHLLLFFIILIIGLYIFKKIIISNKLIKLNNILLPILLFISLGFIFIEKISYPNFVYTYFHLNPYNFFSLSFLSTFIFCLYNFKNLSFHLLFNSTIKFLRNIKIFIIKNLTAKKIFIYLLPLLAFYLSQILSFNIGFKFNVFTTTTVAFNYFLWLSVLLLCISLFKKKSLSLFLFLSLFSVFTLINYLKIKFLNLFFIINDIYLISAVTKVLPETLGQLKLIEVLIIFIALIIFILLIILIHKKAINQYSTFKIRFILFIFSGFILTLPIFFTQQFKFIISKCKIELYLWEPITNCKNNGILFCFYDDLKNFKNPPPQDYNQTTINRIFSDLTKRSSSKIVTENLETTEIKPNIIIILSEAFWDITKLPDISFSSDPIPNIRQDIKLTLVSPTIGSGTGNVEFELLTGFSNYFLGGITPYTQAIRKNIPTLFTAFAESGYQTTTIHPFYALMYNRTQVYKNFGLDNYISMEKMNNVEYSGPYISDKTFTQEILKQYQSTTKPQLIFALSMQNHFPFEINRFPDHKINIKSSLSNDNQNILQTYTDGINLSDQSYFNLKNVIAKSNKPTIIIFFGDHLPLLNPGYKFYQQAKYDYNNQLKMHSTPIAIWSNFKTNLYTKSLLSPNFLSLEILKLAKIKPKYQFLYLQSISQTDTVLQENILPKFTPQQLKNYELIQYDIIFGKQYSLK